MLQCFPRRNRLILIVATIGETITIPCAVQEQVPARTEVLICKNFGLPLMVTVNEHEGCYPANILEEVDQGFPVAHLAMASTHIFFPMIFPAVTVSMTLLTGKRHLS